MTTKHLLLPLALASLLALPAGAQSVKAGVIDLRKCFDSYWKTKQADANLKEEAAGLDKERKNMVEQFQKAQENYKKALDSANDSAASAEERDKRKKSAEDELLKLKGLQDNIEQFDRQARTTLAEKQRRMRDNLLVDIKDVIKAKAKAGNFTLVFDTAAETVNNTPFLLYSNGDNDLTEDVLSQLNIGAPPPPKSSETKPADEKPDKEKSK